MLPWMTFINMIFWFSMFYVVAQMFGYEHYITNGINLFLNQLADVGRKMNVDFGFMSKSFEAIKQKLSFGTSLDSFWGKW